MLLRKNILTALLLLLSASPLICTITYLVKLKVNAHLIAERLEQCSVQTIIVSNDQLIWIEKDKEVLINGKLFDVKSSSTQNDKTWLTGIFDIDEDKILLNMFSMAENEEQSSPFCSMLAYMLCPAILQKTPVPDGFKNIFLKSYNLSFAQSFLYRNPYIGINTPPPNFTAAI